MVGRLRFPLSVNVYCASFASSPVVQSRRGNLSVLLFIQTTTLPLGVKRFKYLSITFSKVFPPFKFKNRLYP